MPRFRQLPSFVAWCSTISNLSMAKSIQSRFAVSLIANLLRSGIAFATGLLVARWMGPQEYGRLVFLLSSFIALRQLLDMGSSTAFFTLLSQQQRTKRFVAIYGGWVAIQLLISILLVYFLLPDEIIERVWVGESRSILLLALVASFMQGTVWSLASQMAEANRETHRVQRLNSLIVILHLVVVVVIWWLGELAISLIFIAMVIEWTVASVWAARMYWATPKISKSDGRCVDTPQSVLREVLSYCLPLIPYAWLGCVSDFADRWMLQTWGGAKNQAYFGVAQQFAAIALLATASILKIFWKEIAEAHFCGNGELVRRLYLKVSRFLYFVGALMAGGLMPWANEILSVTVGNAYSDGALTLMLMFLYPVHQSMGQIGGTVLYATGHVKAKVVIGMVYMVLGLVAAYIVLAPPDHEIPGLGAGAPGLVWKLVGLQVFSANTVAWYIARVHGWKFDWAYQPVGLAVCLFLGWGVHESIFLVLSSGTSAFLQMILAGVCYVALVLGAVLIMPWVAGTTREELSRYARHCLQSVVQRIVHQ